MPNRKNIDLVEINLLDDEIDSALDALTSINLERIAAEKNGSGATGLPEAESFKVMARLFGFDPEDLGRAFTLRGEQFTLEGFETRGLETGGRKRPMVVKRSGDGRMFKMTVESVKRALGSLVFSG